MTLLFLYYFPLTLFQYYTVALFYHFYFLEAAEKDGREGAEKGKIDEVAKLVTDHFQWNSTTRQNPTICNPETYITVTFEPIMPFLNSFRFKMA